MAYNQHTWEDGELITDEKLNNMEQGIADASGASVNISASATADQTIGTASVDVQTTTTAEGTQLAFTFSGIKGEQGSAGAAGAAAGFGTPTATASALEAGATPTVSVTASGEDTAKVFAFTFGIPKGETGSQGPSGADAPTITGCTINISGSTLEGELTMSSGNPIAITGTFNQE